MSPEPLTRPDEHDRKGRAGLLGGQCDRRGPNPQRLAPAGSRTGPASVLAFPGGLTVSEMPLHSLTWQALATAGFVAAGSLRSRPGRAALALTAASWVGLVGLDRVANHADEVLEAALVEGLGPDYRTRMAAAFVPPEDVAIHVPGGRQPPAPAAPALRHQPRCLVRRVRRRNQLDVWRRADLADDAGAPVLIQVHGETWVTGSKEQQGAHSWRTWPNGAG